MLVRLLLSRALVVLHDWTILNGNAPYTTVIESTGQEGEEGGASGAQNDGGGEYGDGTVHDRLPLEIALGSYTNLPPPRHAQSVTLVAPSKAVVDQAGHGLHSALPTAVR